MIILQITVSRIAEIADMSKLVALNTMYVAEIYESMSGDKPFFYKSRAIHKMTI
jgi:hypothetical protein